MSNLPPVGSRSTPGALPRRWLRLGIRLLLFLVIFLSGGVVGVGTTLLVLRHSFLVTVNNPDRVPGYLAAHLRRKLDLTEQQTAQVEDIFRRRQVVLQGIRRRVQPEIEVQLDQVEKEISNVLDDQQRPKWQQDFRELRRTWIPPLPPPAAAPPSQR
jgi:hypothetical protein